MSTTIELARAAGLDFAPLDPRYCDAVDLPRGTIGRIGGVSLDDIEKLIELAKAEGAEAERARLLALAGEPVGDGYTQQFRTGDTPSLAEIKRVVVLTVPVYTADQVAGAVLREREGCAKMCEEYDTQHDNSQTWLNIVADEIRARNQ